MPSPAVRVDYSGTHRLRNKIAIGGRPHLFFLWPSVLSTPKSMHAPVFRRRCGAVPSRPMPGRSYLYLRPTPKEPFNILYVTWALITMTNADDRSSSITPELLYTRLQEHGSAAA